MTHIAVIDDNRETVDFLQGVIEDRGWQMTNLVDGAAAFDDAKGLEPDAVILDLWLDHRDRGWEILEQLRNDPTTQDIPVILCSGLRDTLLQHKDEFGSQVAAVLVKPFTLDDVEACLDFVLATTGAKTSAER